MRVPNQVDELIRSPLAGPVWETFVFSELRKRQILLHGKWGIFFWRDLRGVEVDIRFKTGSWHGRWMIWNSVFNGLNNLLGACRDNPFSWGSI